MKIVAGLWIDHRKTFITVISGKGEQSRVIESGVEKHPGRTDRNSPSAPYEAQLVPADDSRERQLVGQLQRYYDEVIAAIRGADSILICGPGEAKGELKSRLERDDLGGRIVAVENADKMTDREFAATVREYFHR